MNFSLEIGPNTDLETLPLINDVYITLLPGGDYKEIAQKAGDLVKKSFNPVPHFPARSISDEKELKDYVSRCKDFGVKQALVIGGSREPIGKFEDALTFINEYLNTADPKLKQDSYCIARVINLLIHFEKSSSNLSSDTI